MKERTHLALHGKEKDPSVPSFGEYLRRERELREISLREIVDETKISYRYLEALEEDNRPRLPAEVFIKGFIRSYANYIGLDADEAILRYEEYQKTLEITEASRDPGRALRSSGSGETKHVPWTWVVVLLLIALAGIVLFYGYVAWKGRGEPSFPKPPLETQAGKQEPASPGAARGEEGTKPGPLEERTPPTPPVPSENSGSGKSDAVPAPVKVTLSALEKTWLTVDVDSDRHYDVTLQPDEEIHFNLMDSMRLTVGNAGGLLIRANGRTFGPLGESGQVIKNFLMTRKDLSGDRSE